MEIKVNIILVLRCKFRFDGLQASAVCGLRLIDKLQLRLDVAILMCYDRGKCVFGGKTLNQKSMTPLYSAMMCCYWMGFSVIMGFVSVYLLAKGLTSGQVGTAIAVSGTMSALLQPAVAAYADRPDSLGVKKLAMLVGTVMALSGGGMLAVSSPAVCVLLFGICMAGVQMLMPLLNAWGIGNVNGGGHLNIGLSRGFSSVAYAATSFGMGSLVSLLGNSIIPGCILAFYGLFLLASGRFTYLRPKAEAQTANGAGLLEFFGKYPRYTGILAGCSLLFISHVLLNSFTFQIAQHKGGGSTEMGIAMALAALAELPTLMGFQYLLKKRSARVWFRISGIFFTLKALGTLLCTNVTGFYLAQIFQLPGWALISVASIFYINEIVAPEDAVKGQAYYTMAYTVGTVLGALIGGWLIDLLGVSAMLAFSAASGALGAGIVLLFTKE